MNVVVSYHIYGSKIKGICLALFTIVIMAQYELLRFIIYKSSLQRITVLSARKLYCPVNQNAGKFN